MPSMVSLILKSAQRACPRPELGARLEGRTVALPPMLHGCQALEAYH